MTFTRMHSALNAPRVRTFNDAECTQVNTVPAVNVQREARRRARMPGSLVYCSMARAKYFRGSPSSEGTIIDASAIISCRQAPWNKRVMITVRVLRMERPTEWTQCIRRGMVIAAVAAMMVAVGEMGTQIMVRTQQWTPGAHRPDQLSWSITNSGHVQKELHA